jgi:hypothetical protein
MDYHERFYEGARRPKSVGEGQTVLVSSPVTKMRRRQNGEQPNGLLRDKRLGQASCSRLLFFVGASSFVALR